MIRHAKRRSALAGALAGLLAFTAPASAARCGPTELHAHRGSPQHPENSLSAVLAALDDTYDAAEIDLQRLRDGRWVLHHDALTGRTLRGGIPRPVAAYRSSDWRGAQLLDRQGRPSREKPPFFDAVLESAAPRLASGQRQLNIEIKGKYACEDIRAAVQEVGRQLPRGSWFFTSVDLDALHCIRQLDPDVYLGVIVAPEPNEGDPRQQAALNALKRFGVDEERVRQKAAAAYEDRFNRQFLSETGLRDLHRRFGHVGIHLDAASLARDPNLLIHAREHRLRLFTYHGRGDKQHGALVGEVARHVSALPDGLIIDGAPDQMCAELRRYGI